MATASSESTFNLRHRLVGAFILIALAVFVLPMVLRGATTDEKTVTVDIATPSEKRQPKQFQSRVTPVGTGAEKVVQQVGEDGSKVVSFEGTKPDEPKTPEVAVTTPAAPEAPNAPAAPAVKQPVTIVPPPPPDLPKVQVKPAEPSDEVVIASTAPPVPSTPEVKLTPAPAKAPAPKPAAKPKPKVKTGSVPDSNLNITTDRGWVVRVGTFGQPSNARTMARLLQSKGFAPRSTKEKTKEGLTMTRVWVGPFPERVTAGRVLEKILKQTGEKGFISPYP